MLRNMCLCLLLPEAETQVRLDERGHPLRPQHREPAVEAGDRLVGGLGPVVDPGADADAEPGASQREGRAHDVLPNRVTGGSRRTVPGSAARWVGLVPVTRRSRSNSPATTKQAPQSIASRASASARASQRLGVRIRNDISATSAIAGTLASTLSCCATRVSETREETARPTQIAHAASSGMKTASAGSCAAFHISVATAGFANSATIAMNTPNTRYERPTAGMKIAAALPAMSSVR